MLYHLGRDNEGFGQIKTLKAHLFTYLFIYPFILPGVFWIFIYVYFMMWNCHSPKSHYATQPLYTTQGDTLCHGKLLHQIKDSKKNTISVRNTGSKKKL